MLPALCQFCFQASNIGNNIFNILLKDLCQARQITFTVIQKTFKSHSSYEIFVVGCNSKAQDMSCVALAFSSVSLYAA